MVNRDSRFICHACGRRTTCPLRADSSSARIAATFPRLLSSEMRGACPSRMARSMSSIRRAARLFGAARVLRKEAETSLPLAERVEYDRELSTTRAQLDTAAFDAMWQAGQTMSIDQMMELALSEAASS